MSPVQPPALVLVTGANGYVASWVVHNLLHKGFSVRATVRSHGKGKHFAEEGSWSKPFFDDGKLEVVVVEDITKEGAFDDAVKGVDAIEHTASPVTLNADDPQELIVPAVNGTLNVLKSALKIGSIKRVVITGSCASIVEILPQPKVFNESDWDEQAIREVNEMGRGARPMLKYRASKTLAEKAAWDWYKEHKSKIDWDLVVLNPPYVFGPTIQAVSTPKDLGASMLDLHNTIFVPGYKSKEGLYASSSYVDVRDLGEAHVRALLRDEAGGERIIISSVDVAHSLEPNPIPSHPDLHKGFPYETEKPVYMIRYDGTKAGKLLHMGSWEAPEGVSDWYRLKGKEEITRDVLADCERRGW
ncbi:D-lactaldehyde dehydrogenase [Pluteus cervinus]|uniref:D-lactaldehyde dehydrogenase n=1 Tax=Pluteus cervinus TaxID=181527 RepID=A0ACD3ACD2_9AGAR|nr:D-lactaldehyde dehydrogenase [Pluteus cervinus]